MKFYLSVKHSVVHFVPCKATIETEAEEGKQHSRPSLNFSVLLLITDSKRCEIFIYQINTLWFTSSLAGPPSKLKRKKGSSKAGLHLILESVICKSTETVARAGLMYSRISIAQWTNSLLSIFHYCYWSRLPYFVIYI